MSDNLFYIGKFNETTVDDAGEEMIKEAELFSVGTHRGKEYTIEDLQALADNFDADSHVPVQLDHSESARDTVGFLKEVKVEGDKLLGKLHIIDSYAKERVNLNLMNKLSVSFYTNGRKPSRLREVSLVAFPQVKSARLFSENGYISDYKDDEGGNDMTEQKIDLAELKKQLKEELEGEIHEQYSELQKQVETLQGAGTQLKEAQITSKIEKFSADNKVVPAQTDALTRLLASFSEEQTLAFEEFISNAQAVDFSEKGEFEGKDGNEDEKDKRTQEQKDFDKFYEEHTAKHGLSL